VSAPRFIAVACVVIAALLCAPNALVPGFNGADLVVVSAPILVVVIVASRRHKSPVGGVASPSVRTPSAVPSAGSPSVDGEARP
jgi:hypothetical protein